jgi:hypothetical protein
MVAVQGTYDNGVVFLDETIPFQEKCKVIVTFLRETGLNETINHLNGTIEERLSLAESLFGILPPHVTIEEAKEERLRRYESGN